MEAEPSPLDGDEPGEPVEGQGRGDQRSSAARKPRRKPPSAPAEKTNKRGLHLTDSVWDRLQYEAIRKRTTVSAIAGELLERTLPRFKVEREA
jgi:macrodomain Ter protein organizer (MatP/YcbG family)